MGLFNFRKPKTSLPSEIDDIVKKAYQRDFPGGQVQLDQETAQLHTLLRGKLSKADCEILLRRTKSLLVIAEDKSESRITSSMIAHTKGRLTQQEASMVYMFLTGRTGPATSGGDGSSAEQAVVINATSSIVGISEEYDYIERECGKRDIDYTVSIQMKTNQNGRSYDVISIELKSGEKRAFWFDITAFLGKF